MSGRDGWMKGKSSVMPECDKFGLHTQKPQKRAEEGEKEARKQFMLTRNMLH